MLRPFLIIARGARARGNERDLDLFEVIKQWVQPNWWFTIDTLHALMSIDIETAMRCNRITKVWMELGGTLGLDKKQEKAAYESEKKRVAQLCGWRECEFHTVVAPTATRLCAGCGEVVRRICRTR